MTGKMEPSMARVSYHEIANRRTIAPKIKMKDLTNIDTFVLKPSWITDVSEFILLTTSEHVIN